MLLLEQCLKRLYCFGNKCGSYKPDHKDSLAGTQEQRVMNIEFFQKGEQYEEYGDTSSEDSDGSICTCNVFLCLV